MFTQKNKSSLWVETLINPFTIGPNTGPLYGPNENRAIPIPRCSLDQISAIVPPAKDRAELANTPQRKRHTSRAPMFGASAQGILKMV
ncbi:hypothetical protein AWJ20_3334 [Sugiyamaella lignohabitans]|uniref:Uncharacterized protein n=1 Tax=Sugiyamaella lignohabitans TaxID=796027 RepID=A0A167FTU9_9ASCO|nr:uncharacterized protein AWJ20_3334 [Sugiyamaella lignohabitans]ANB15695.1 hypothetical protein AWJ20_3334 [Sugiyamaella lignohabitans]